ncbi:MAG: tetratricopeptide repeat protein [Bacteroidaceae bacterium]|nr:tetratricopeptide repeat protein [Bacteroidaceae bacterium]
MEDKFKGLSYGEVWEMLDDCQNLDEKIKVYQKMVELGEEFIPDDLDLYAAPLDNLAACYMKRNEYAKAVPLLERALLLYRIQEFNDSDFAYQRCNALKKMVECQKELCNKTLAILYEHELRLLEDGLGKK